MKWMLAVNRDFHSDELLDSNKVPTFTFVAKSVGYTTASRSCSSPNSMDVTFGFIGQIIIENVCNPLDIDTSARNIGCYENWDTAIFESG